MRGEGCGLCGVGGRAQHRLWTPTSGERRILGVVVSHRPVLSRERFRRVVDESYPSMYFTIVSIIQGVALGTVLIKASGFYRAGELADAALVSLLGLLMIVYVWFAYVTAGITYGWEPGWIGSFLPFAIGLLESAVILASARPEVMFWLFALMSICGVAEHVDMSLELSRTDSDCPDVLKHEIEYQKKQTIVFCTLTAVMASAAVVWHSWPGLPTWIALSGAGALFVFLNAREHIEWVRTLVRLDSEGGCA